jgi:hypothetical protein
MEKTSRRPRRRRPLPYDLGPKTESSEEPLVGINALKSDITVK